MTNNEAIEILKGAIKKPNTKDGYLGQALDMAIEALKQATCEDCISRQAAIDSLNEYFARIGKLKRRGLNEGEKAISLDTIGAIKTLPPVTPQQKTGRWIIKEGKGQGYDIAGVKTWYIQIMCDKCGFIKTAIEGHTGQYRYCPSCGARMEKNEIHCMYSLEEVTKSFIEDVSAVEDQLEDKEAEDE